MLREHSRTQNKLKQDLGSLFYRRFRMKRSTRFCLILTGPYGWTGIKGKREYGAMSRNGGQEFDQYGGQRIG